MNEPIALGVPREAIPPARRSEPRTAGVERLLKPGVIRGVTRRLGARDSALVTLRCAELEPRLIRGLERINDRPRSDDRTEGLICREVLVDFRPSDRGPMDNREPRETPELRGATCGDLPSARRGTELATARRDAETGACRIVRLGVRRAMLGVRRKDDRADRLMLLALDWLDLSRLAIEGVRRPVVRRDIEGRRAADERSTERRGVERRLDNCRGLTVRRATDLPADERCDRLAASTADSGISRHNPRNSPTRKRTFNLDWIMDMTASLLDNPL